MIGGFTDAGALSGWTGPGCFYQKHVTDQVHETIDRVEVEEADGPACYAVAAYSTRAKPRAPISVPLMWKECSPELRSERFTLNNSEERLSRLAEDPWAEYAKLRQHLTVSMKRRLADR